MLGAPLGINKEQDLSSLHETRLEDGAEDGHTFIVALASYNYILLRIAAILYLLPHTLTHLDRLSDCESFKAEQVALSRGHLEQGLCEEVEWIGTKEGEDCMEGKGGGGIVVEGGYRGEGREEGGHNSMAQLPLGFGPLKIKRILRQQRRIRANCIRLGSPNIFVVNTFIPSRFRRCISRTLCNRDLRH
jgi:hypothetical protein